MNLYNILRFFSILIFAISMGCGPISTRDLDQQPNIVLIYLDDLGFGDPQCYNSQSKIPTPNIDKLARQGIRFTNAHTPAPICGPSRYGLLTGRYPWRRGDSGFGNGPKFRDTFIEKGRMTLASLLRNNGYNTAQFGKWGLRHNYSDAVKPGMKPGTKDAYDFKNKRLLGAQLFGFDYSWCLTYLFPAPGTPIISDSKHQFENGLPVDTSLIEKDPYQWLPESAFKVCEYIEVYAGKKENSNFGLYKNKPFFIYWDPPSPHEPIVPNKEFIGKSGAGKYGDFVYEIDHYIGLIIKVLDESQLSKNTLVIFSSDNGPEKIAYERINEYDHYSMGNWRGLKRDSWEGGNRVPFIVKWPEHINPGMVEKSPICLTDIYATFSELLNLKLPNDQGEDSFSLVPLLLKKNSEKFERAPIIYFSSKKEMGIHAEDWVMLENNIGNKSREPEWFRKKRGVVKHSEKVELFDLSKDPQQLKNLSLKYPEKVNDLNGKLNDIIQNGRSR
jgi:arylsulfatase A